jgi:hypothetical protein
VTQHGLLAAFGDHQPVGRPPERGFGDITESDGTRNLGDDVHQAPGAGRGRECVDGGAEARESGGILGAHRLDEIVVDEPDLGLFCEEQDRKATRSFDDLRVLLIRRSFCARLSIQDLDDPAGETFTSESHLDHVALQARQQLAPPDGIAGRRKTGERAGHSIAHTGGKLDGPDHGLFVRAEDDESFERIVEVARWNGQADLATALDRARAFEVADAGFVQAHVVERENGLFSTPALTRTNRQGQQDNQQALGAHGASVLVKTAIVTVLGPGQKSLITRRLWPTAEQHCRPR